MIDENIIYKIDGKEVEKGVFEIERNAQIQVFGQIEIKNGYDSERQKLYQDLISAEKLFKKS